MHIDSFQSAQRDMARQALFSLFAACKERFLTSARLLEIRGPIIEKVLSAGSGSNTVDLWPLFAAYETLTRRYTDLYFSSQSTLFNDPSEAEDAKWSKYFYHMLMPTLVQNDVLVRNILRSLMVLPCESPKAAADAINHEFSEMTFPTESPTWGYETDSSY